MNKALHVSVEARRRPHKEDVKVSVVALIGHGSEFSLMSHELLLKGEIVDQYETQVENKSSDLRERRVTW